MNYAKVATIMLRKYIVAVAMPALIYPEKFFHSRAYLGSQWMVVMLVCVIVNIWAKLSVGRIERGVLVEISGAISG